MKRIILPIVILLAFGCKKEAAKPEEEKKEISYDAKIVSKWILKLPDGSSKKTSDTYLYSREKKLVAYEWCGEFHLVTYKDNIITERRGKYYLNDKNQVVKFVSSGGEAVEEYSYKDNKKTATKVYWLNTLRSEEFYKYKDGDVIETEYIRYTDNEKKRSFRKYTYTTIERPFYMVGTNGLLEEVVTSSKHLLKRVESVRSDDDMEDNTICYTDCFYKEGENTVEELAVTYSNIASDSVYLMDSIITIFTYSKNEVGL